MNDETEQINKHFQNTLNHIQSKKDSSDENEADIYKDFVLWNSLVELSSKFFQMVYIMEFLNLTVEHYCYSSRLK